MSATQFVSPENLVKATELIKDWVNDVIPEEMVPMTEQEVETAIGGVLNATDE